MKSVFKNSSTYIKACVAKVAYASKTKQTQYLDKQNSRVKKELSTTTTTVVGHPHYPTTFLCKKKIQLVIPPNNISYYNNTSAFSVSSFSSYNNNTKTKQHRTLRSYYSSSVSFEVKRCPPELITPANPTPRELKLLSDIDDQATLREHVPFVHFYRYEPSMVGKDPVSVIRQALAKTLVFYYPFAGRLREAPNGKLMVDCTGEGVMFVEADADVTLDDLGKEIHPPFPYFDKLLFDIPRSDQFINSPLLLMQVTHLKCGSFILAYCMNHTMGDAVGIFQFMKGLAEIACGASKPSILPVWSRELLCARNPPRITCTHHEFQQPLENEDNSTLHHRPFFFCSNEIAAIRRLFPLNHEQSTSSEVLSAFLWRCYTATLWKNPYQEVCFMYLVNARYGRCSFNPPLPDGFYGNAFVCPGVVTTVGKLCGRPLGYALELVKKAKNRANEEYVRSVADLLVIKGRPPYFSSKAVSLEVTDISKVGFEEVNFGWGKAVYAGTIRGYFKSIAYLRYTNTKGEQGRIALVCLPQQTMERFEKELNDLLKIENNPRSIVNNERCMIN